MCVWGVGSDGCDVAAGDRSDASLELPELRILRHAPRVWGRSGGCDLARLRARCRLEGGGPYRGELGSRSVPPRRAAPPTALLTPARPDWDCSESRPAVLPEGNLRSALNLHSRPGSSKKPLLRDDGDGDRTEAEQESDTRSRTRGCRSALRVECSEYR